ncbi:hypothetical protein [Paraburkholderia domus]|jgi:hypothetical protein|uniref:VIT family protein n=1 Tax=Paraburkholderia domus TaxID=2793075 RepID=A0A9N8N3S2_9BURK|nr:hypothetical protein [Paraburkholderia domus]MBK5052230.1 hypothetical protein [Burkholderia sp. R-70006]MBK5064385.1 hypothetical protein [Burkholderia sp. R-70199]MBK5168357.1 hypothetical protein [Burkholderia sp. R-70211]MBK5183468.1 hypothetical protein [Burkholderia sp. R-69749]CAE6762705.1 hypothetical protein R75483_03635 [Paraburkholderia domus]
MSIWNEEYERLLDPIDRISEILFGLIMAVTIIGSLSIATAGQTQVRTVTLSALGCNLAWGLVDAVMYLMRTATERTHNRLIARQACGADPETACRLIGRSLPAHVARVSGPEEIEGMRRRLLTLEFDGQPVLHARDFLEACGVFFLVVIATFPVVLPFLLTTNVMLAMRLSRIITLGMLFFTGMKLGQYAGYAKPARTGFAMALLGAALIAAVMALGG